MPQKAKEIVTITDELANIPKDGDPAFEEKEKETPTETPAETTNDETKPSQEGEKTPAEKDLPFHEHPRWKQREKDWEDRFHTLESTYATKLQEFEQKFKPASDVKIPEWFSTLYGENQEAWQKYSKYDAELRAQIKSETLAELKKEGDKQTQAQKRWEDYTKKSISELKDSGEEFDENELTKFMFDYNEKYGNVPVEANGNWSFKKSLELMRQLKGEEKPKSTVKKELAATTTTRSSEGSKDTFLTSKDIRGKDWRSIIKT